MSKILTSCVLLLILTVACSLQPEPDPDNIQYKFGYESGEKDGIAKGKTQKCEEIEAFSDNIMETLRNNGVCG